jgi:hypothetical protein
MLVGARPGCFRTTDVKTITSVVCRAGVIKRWTAAAAVHTLVEEGQ